MNYIELASWIQTDLIKKGYLSFNQFPKALRLTNTPLVSSLGSEQGQAIAKLLQKALKILTKKRHYPIYWFKINQTDNALTQLVGMGELSDLTATDLLLDLVTKDTAAQGGDTTVGLLDEEKKWLLKLTNNPDGRRIYVKVYAEDYLKEKLEQLVPRKPDYLS